MRVDDRSEAATRVEVTSAGKKRENERQPQAAGGMVMEECQACFSRGHFAS